MAGLPTGVQIDIEFSAGTWTNVTAYVDATAGLSARFGRTDVKSSPQVASLSLRLDNNDGRFTIKNAISPYYPNVVPRKRIRLTYNSGTSPLFLGYIKSWLPQLEGGVRSFAALECVDRLEALGRRALRTATTEAILALLPTGYWPLSDDAKVTLPATLTELTGNRSGLWSKNVDTGVTTYTLGATPCVPIPDGGTGLGGSFMGSGTIAPIVCQVPSFTTTTMTLVGWAAVNLAGSFQFALTGTGGSPGVGIGMTLASFVTSFATDGTLVRTLNPGVSGANFVALVFSGGSFSIYQNGALVGTSTAGLGSLTLSAAQMTVSGTGSTAQHFAYWEGTALTAPQIADLYSSGLGYSGDVSGARVTRLLGYANLTAPDYNVATGQETMGPAKLSGKSVASALADVMTTEAGGSAAFVDTDGRVRYADRAFRVTGTPVMTLDATKDLDGGTWQPSFDDYSRVNRSDVTLDKSGVVQAYVDASNSTTPFNDTATSYANSENAALNLAQWRVNATANQLRLPQVAVDFLTSENATALYAALPSVTIGSRIRVSNIPTTVQDTAGATSRTFHVSQLDGYVEGWSLQITIDTFRIVYDLSSADVIPPFIWSDTTYGRWQPDTGSMTLAGTITNAATTLQVSTLAGKPTFSTTPGDYPLSMQLDEEILTLNSAPGGATSPQTFASVTRAQQGTFADAHTVGATVNLWPASAWNL